MENFAVNFATVQPSPDREVKDVISQYGLIWYWYRQNKPQQCNFTQAGLLMTPKPGSDFWRRKYQNPPADRDSGHALLHSISNTGQSCEIEAMFSVTPDNQYDHAGLFISIDDKHWLKAGYELVDNVHQMSCVVTNDQSDWNSLDWASSKDITVKVSLYRYDLFIECKVEYKDGDQWKFLREAPLFLGVSNADVSFGLMCCGPQQKTTGNGMEVVFHNLTCTTS